MYIIHIINQTDDITYLAMCLCEHSQIVKKIVGLLLPSQELRKHTSCNQCSLSLMTGKWRRPRPTSNINWLIYAHPSQHDVLTQCWFNIVILAQH